MTGVRATPARPRRSTAPTLRVERALQRGGHRLLAGMDEVGRGALAGPVTVGIVVIDETCRSAPTGVRDSKLLTHAARERLLPRIERWAPAYAVGHASAQEIDLVGIIAALRLAGLRALAALPVRPDLIVLDGNHDWLTPPERVGLFEFAEAGSGELSVGSEASARGAHLFAPYAVSPPVTTMIKADLRCSSVAAASVLAKVTRDRLMIELDGDHPAYGWAGNKGYAAPDHLAALDRHGPCELHRRSWRLPGSAADGPGAGGNGAEAEVIERDDADPSATTDDPDDPARSNPPLIHQ